MLTRHIMAPLAIAALAIAALAGCGSSSTGSVRTSPSPEAPPTCQPIYAALNLSQSDATTSDSEGRCLPQKLSFTGELAGDVRIAQANRLCTKPLARGDFPPSPELQMLIGGKPYSLVILPSRGYDPGKPSVSAGPGNGGVEVSVADKTQFSTESLWLAQRGTIKFNPDGTTGSIDVDVMRNVPGAQPGHVSGDWHCGATAASPAPTASSANPCAAIASGPGLSADDAARLQAAPCLPEDLTLTNPVSGHADHGVGVEPSVSSFRDVPCGGTDDRHYVSSVAFAVQNQTFFFVIELVTDPTSPPFGPGEYGPTVPNALADTPSAYVVSGSIKWSAKTGKFTIAPDKHSGTVEMDFLRSATNETVHISGSWRCA